MSNQLEIASSNKGLFNRNILLKNLNYGHKKVAKLLKDHFEKNQIKNPYLLTIKQLQALSEDDTIDYYVKPILEILGFKYVRNRQDSNAKYPDIWLFLNDPEDQSPQYLQKSNLTILEVKKYQIDLDVGKSNDRRKPPQQLNDYIKANIKYNSRKRWGILTNGFKWRLYCSDGIDKYIEFDIDHTLENNEELELFCLVFSPQSFIIDRERSDLLSNLQKESLDSWVYITTEIEERGNEILCILVNGFYESGFNLSAAKEAAYDTIFMLLFVLYIESKHLLPKGKLKYANVSLRNILHEINEVTLNEFDISKRLTELFSTFKLGKGILSPNYGGEHFEKIPEIRIKNIWLKKALELLTVFESDRAEIKFFDYSSLNVELIGNIYEYTLSLDFSILPSNKIEIKKLKKKSGTQAHSTGTTYTPPSVVKYLINESFPDKFSKLPFVCDPACGSGHFLIQALRYLSSNISFDLTGAESLQDHKLKICKKSIFGTDNNILAARLARLMLVIETTINSKAVEDFRMNIKNFDALLTPLKDNQWLAQFESKELLNNAGFDFVIGNPPYVRADEPGIGKIRKDILNSNQYKWLSKKWDMFIPFIELSYNLVKKTKGSVGLVVSNGITYAPYAKNCVQFLIQSQCVKFVSHFEKPFEKWAFPATCFVLDLSKNYINSERRIHKENSISKIDKSDIVKNPFNTQSKENLSKLVSKWNGFKFSNTCYISKGMVLNSHENLKKDINFIKSDLLSNCQNETHPVEFVDSEDVGFGNFRHKKKRYIEYGVGLRAPKNISRKTFPELHFDERILLGRSKNMNCSVYTDKEIIVSDNVLIIKRWVDLLGVENQQIKKKVNTSKVTSGIETDDVVTDRGILESVSDKVSYHLLIGILLSNFFNKWINSDKRHKHVIVPDVVSELPIPIKISRHIESKVYTFNLSFERVILEFEKLDPEECYEKLVNCIEQVVIKIQSLTSDSEIHSLKGYLNKLVELFYRPVSSSANANTAFDQKTVIRELLGIGTDRILKIQTHPKHPKKKLKVKTSTKKESSAL